MQDPIYSRIESQPRPSLYAASGLALLAAVGLWISSLIELALPPDAPGLLLNAIYYLPFMALPMALYARRRPGLAPALRLNPPPFFSTLLLGLMAILTVYTASAVSAAWGYALNTLGLRGIGPVPLPQSEGELIASVISMAAFPALCEELLFRGFMLSAWETRGTVYAVGVTSLLFALLHGNLYGLPAYLLVGGIAGYATCALDSVYGGVIFHTVYNAACLTIPYLMGQTQSGGAESAFNTARIFALAVQTLMMLGLTGVGLTSLWLRARNAGMQPIPRIRRPLRGREKAMLLAAVGVMLTSLAVLTIMAAARA